jgi:Protein of unknown function (DUF1553)/Protein of unknown function (DUF1549)
MRHATIVLGLCLSLTATRAVYTAQSSTPAFTEVQKSFWSLQQVKKPAVPVVKAKQWVNNPIDAFVLAKLEEKQLQPNKPADKITLLRRVAIDLTGLVPTPEEIQAFVNDTSANAYEKVVDRLLASPAYGERWGRHWLDVARYADSNGYKADETRADIWRYRDYVIQAFNDDKPYDRFVREQIAGDELYPGDTDALVAMGFNRNWIDETNAAGLVIRRQETLDEITNVTGTAFLGMTFACARCHDHKYDPIPQKDYYRLQAFFANTSFGDGPIPLKDPVERKKYEEQYALWDSKTKVIRDEMSKLLEPLRRSKMEGGIKTFEDDVKEAILMDPSKRDPWQQMMYHTAEPRVAFDEEPDARTLRSLKGDAATRYTELKKDLAQFDALRPKALPRGQYMIDISSTAPATYVHLRGDPYSKGEEVQPGFLSILDPSDQKATPPAGLNTTGRRTVLANWLVDPKNPLTARVMVNRIWQYHFGTGIVATSGDFGRMGSRPTHPELLDYLASTFVENGWSMKKMHRLIVLSNTYRQSSDYQDKSAAADPDDKLLWRYNRHRMEAEAIRDSMLEVSGVLNSRMGGPGVFPPVPEGTISALSATAAAGGWSSEKDPAQNNRRSVYIFVRRNLRYPMLQEFDSPNTFEVWHTRKNTVTPVQALDILNNDLILNWARGLAGRILSESGRAAEPWENVDRAYKLAYGRGATADELKTAGAFLDKQTSIMAKRLAGSGEKPPLPANLADGMDPARAAAFVDLCQMLFASNEFLYIN